MFQRNAMVAFFGSGASTTVLTGQGYFGAISLYASGAAATITVYDSGKQLFAWSGAAGATNQFTPVFAIACTAGLSVTNSGAGTYCIVYSSQ